MHRAASRHAAVSWAGTCSIAYGGLRPQPKSPTLSFVDVLLHLLTGDRQGYWSVTIRLPWCITFKFSKGEFSEVMIENYH
jgi:hypothetical protein